MRSSERLLGILHALGNSPAISLTEIAAIVGLPKSTTLRFLGALEPDGWIINDEAGRYRLGPSVLAIASQYIAHDSLVVAASRPMRELRDELKETISLSRAAGGIRVCVREVPSLEPLRLVLGVGQTGPLHAGASGLLLLAYTSRERRQRVYEQGLAPYTSRTIVDPERLEAEVKCIRARGWAISHGQKTVRWHRYRGPRARPCAGHDRRAWDLRTRGAVPRAPRPTPVAGRAVADRGPGRGGEPSVS